MSTNRENGDKINLVSDLVSLTGINVGSLTKLVSYANLSIAEAVKESKLNGDTITTIDIGIGTLSILVEDNSIKSKFTISSDLKDSLLKEFKSSEKSSKLSRTLDLSLIKRIDELYREII